MVVVGIYFVDDFVTSILVPHLKRCTSTVLASRDGNFVSRCVVEVFSKLFIFACEFASSFFRGVRGGRGKGSTQAARRDRNSNDGFNGCLTCSYSDIFGSFSRAAVCRIQPGMVDVIGYMGTLLPELWSAGGNICLPRFSLVVHIEWSMYFSLSCV